MIINRSFAKLLLLVGLITVIVTAQNVSANAWIEPIIEVPHSARLANQRELFKQASKMLGRGQLSRFNTALADLTDYPLYPYLVYAKHRRYLTRTTLEDVNTFAETYADTPLADRLRQAWLKRQLSRGETNNFLGAYRPTNDIAERCRYRRVLLKAGHTGAAFAELDNLWLTGKSQPRACDPLFTAWRKANLLSSDLAWRRFVLAMDNRKLQLARYLKRFMDDDDAYWADLWLRVHRYPTAVLETKRFRSPHPYRSRILLYGIERQARSDPEQANRNLKRLSQRYTFTTAERSSIDHIILMRRVADGDFGALKDLAALNIDTLPVKLQELRLRNALRNQQWSLVSNWVDQLPTEQRETSGWRYWRARALDATGNRTEANKLFAGLSLGLGYYSFLAAEQLGIAPRFNNETLPTIHHAQDFLHASLAAQRAHELLALGRIIEARREWYKLSQGLDEADLLLAARLAHEWGWHDRAIATLGLTSHRNHLEPRFPRPFDTLVRQHADSHGLDPNWVYAIMRQESTFMTDIKSPAGALGLMQLMPKTAKLIAKRGHVRLKNKSQLLQPDTNIALGTSYLRQMLDRFDNNPMLAAAAYNAGPYRISRWLPEDCAVPIDIWIETIPFKETRHYVQRVAAYTTIYAHRTGIDARLATREFSNVGTRQRGSSRFACQQPEVPVTTTSSSPTPVTATRNPV
jgi:soluble lytic murein transglycosylase